MCDLCVEVVEHVEAHLVLDAEHQDDRIYPGAELELRRTPFISDEEQVAPVIYHDLLLEPPAWRAGGGGGGGGGGVEEGAKR